MNTQIPRQRIEDFRRHHRHVASVDDVGGRAAAPRPNARRFVLWRSVIHSAPRSLGGEASLSAVLGRIADSVDRRWLYRDWEAKVVYLLRKDPAIARIGRDTWQLRRRAGR